MHRTRNERAPRVAPITTRFKLTQRKAGGKRFNCAIKIETASNPLFARHARSSTILIKA